MDSAVRYRLDPDDRIASVNPAFLEFARGNDGEELTSDRVVGRPIWEFLVGAEAISWYQEAFRVVRAERRPIAVPFRCDGPAVRRHMRLLIGGDGSLSVASLLVQEEARSPVPLLDRNHPRSSEWLPICSWCKAVRLGAKEWVEVEVAVTHLRLLPAEPVPRLWHSVCPACEAMLDDLL